jgi:hypothetical protein
MAKIKLDRWWGLNKRSILTGQGFVRGWEMVSGL